MGFSNGLLASVQSQLLQLIVQYTEVGADQLGQEGLSPQAGYCFPFRQHGSVSSDLGLHH